MSLKRTIGLAALAGLVPATLVVTGAAARAEFVTVDRFVAHTSTVPANAGQRVGIFVHEKVSADLALRVESGYQPEGRVVLFVHGGSVPSVPDYDLPYMDYSWMAYLATAGFDTFSMDQTGYGLSPRPMMGDPCNMSEDDRAIVTPNPLAKDCQPHYRYGLSTSQSDWDEIDSVVDYVRELRGVDRVSLVGWSAGGPRTGGYAARHPEKVDKLILFAPAYRADGPSAQTGEVPRPGVPMRLQTRETLMDGRWASTIQCQDQVDPDIQDVIWRTIMSYDQLGSVWGPRHGVMRVRRSGGSWGWNRDAAAQVRAPTLILVGEQDGLRPSAQTLYGDLTVDAKVLVTMACATDFAVWETTQYQFLHAASREWLEHTTWRGHAQGTFTAERNSVQNGAR